MADTLDAAFAALVTLCADPLAYTDDTAEQAARVAAQAELRGTLARAEAQAAADLAAASFGTPIALLAAVDAAEREARAVIAGAYLA